MIYKINVACTSFQVDPYLMFHTQLELNTIKIHPRLHNAIMKLRKVQLDTLRELKASSLLK